MHQSRQTVKTGMPSKDFDAILVRIRHFCAHQERCSQEVDLKLEQWKVSPAKIKRVKLHLVREGFLHDERFARIFVRSKFHINKWGRNKIRYELKSRTIPDNLVSRALEEICEEDYLLTLRELILKKKSEMNSGKSLNIREKIITFVSGKGYEFDLITKVLTELKI